MMLLLLDVLCVCCTATFDVDAARRVAEVAAMLQHYGHRLRAIENITRAESVVKRMIELAEAVENSVCRSQVFWEKACWCGVSGDEVRSELRRLEDLRELFEETRNSTTLDRYAEDEVIEAHEVAVLNVEDCCEWLRLHEGVRERVRCGVCIDFCAVQRALELSTDAIGFFYRYMQMAVPVNKMNFSREEASEKELAEEAVLFEKRMREMEEYVAGCSLRKYVEKEKERCVRQHAPLAGILEQCNEVRRRLGSVAEEAEKAFLAEREKQQKLRRGKSGRLDDEAKNASSADREKQQKLRRGRSGRLDDEAENASSAYIANNYEEKIRNLCNELDGMCEQAKEKLISVSVDVEGMRLAESFFPFAEHYRHEFRIQALRSAVKEHRRMFLGEHESAACCVM